jgi:hypothetical protein
MVTTSGNPDSRSDRGQKIQDAFIVEQITQPINWKSKKQYLKEYSQKPEVKEQAKAYYQRPEVKEQRNAYMREYYQRPEAKAKLKEYQQQPEVKERMKQTQQERRHKPENIMREKSRYSLDREIHPERIQAHKLSVQKYYREHKQEKMERQKQYFKEHPEAHEQHKKHRKYLQKEYYNKGITKKQAGVERHLEAKKKLGFSNIELEQVI